MLEREAQRRQHLQLDVVEIMAQDQVKFITEKSSLTNAPYVCRDELPVYLPSMTRLVQPELCKQEKTIRYGIVTVLQINVLSFALGFDVSDVLPLHSILS
jgi:hypothetical protein